MLPIAATQPPGDATRLDTFRGALAGELLLRLAQADADTALAEALDRWELSLFQHAPFRSEQLRASLAALLEETWPLRAAMLLENDPPARSALYADLAEMAAGGEGSEAAQDAARRVLVEALRHPDRRALIRELDGALLGAAAPPGMPVAV